MLNLHTGNVAFKAQSEGFSPIFNNFLPTGGTQFQQPAQTAQTTQPAQLSQPIAQDTFQNGTPNTAAASSAPSQPLSAPSTLAQTSQPVTYELIPGDDAAKGAKGTNNAKEAIPIKLVDGGASIMVKQPDPYSKENIKKTLISLVISLGTIFAMLELLPRMMRKGLNGKGAAGAADDIKEYGIKVWENLTNAKTIQDMALPESQIKLLDKIRTTIQNPGLVVQRGGKSVNSILLYGPPGTGKTTFAKALAKEFPDSMFASLDITQLNSKYHGETGKRINAAVDAICKAATDNPQKKIFVFVDEIDSVMMADSGPNAKLSNDILNEFKKCFTEKLGKHNNIITIGATNLPIDIEKGVTKSGKRLDRPMLDRFEQKVLVDLPTSGQLLDSLTTHYSKCDLVDSALKNKDNQDLKTLCDFLANKDYNVSFRTMNSIYNDTASNVTSGNQMVTLQDLLDTIKSRQSEFKFTDIDWQQLLSKLGQTAAAAAA